MKNFNYLILLLIIGNSFIASAQNSKQRKADRLYNDLAYLEAVDIYKELIEKDFNTAYNKQQLADSYSKLRRPEDAVYYYTDVVKQADVSPEYYFKFAQALRGVKRYDESRTWLAKYQETGKNTSDVKELLSDDMSKIKNRDDYTLEKAKFNSDLSDFGAYEKNGVTYLISARNEAMPKNKKVYSWNGEPFLDIYIVKDEMVSPISGDVNSVLHDGPLSITNDGKYLYFTRNNYINNKEGKKDKKSTNNLKIYRATNLNGSWKEVVELPFNDNEYSVGHPSLSSDNKSLYFTSDMPGGQGGTDIYKVEITGDNTYGVPVNLGKEINTSLDEAFPFLTTENILYFSSNGHLGLGLMDIFKTDLNTTSLEITNLGAPINSSKDDFAYFQKSEENTGWIASNRDGINDDVYEFNLLKPLVLKGTVTDDVNNLPIANATIRLMGSDNSQFAFLETDNDGKYTTIISRDTKYPFEAKHIEYTEKSGEISSFDLGNKEELIYDIQLSPIPDVEYLAEINNIYFDFDKSNIRKDAATELDKLVALMTEKYPNLVIEIGSHTDFRGSDAYNEALAIRRAESTYNYLVSHGIAPERIVAYKGYGEKQPAVKCDTCNSKQHQLNRRSMFKVVKMK
ncbi:WD40-like Beta Propeller Repeat [Gillisia sp. Hel1_33_143]|uniref:OmpA family protein n=1 Tax=Gillisia sp. Hel1_33_143 TaxID=1336796 RepID=UPI00087ADAE8|nr:OmpA family protein [Gillisia sp. Hel1_33_143]SDS64903.1 WD40-like Beta Propeller Repeat [Gillisia sp. Hel1_33_143]